MKCFDKEKFLNPEAKFRINPMMHSYSPKEDPSVMAKLLKKLGYGGAVINPIFNDESFADDESLENFQAVAENLKNQGLDYWIYDDRGYISGHANGINLKGHPELEGKGFFMVRRVAYEPKHTTFTIDDETDKIIWAAKYPMDLTNKARSLVCYDQMIPVPFTDTFTECDLDKNEALFVFCQKPTYEGSHLTHNTVWQARYIDMMNEKAVARFIELAYDRIAEKCPDIYKNAAAVFTDEPSLQVNYHVAYETWPYALAPYTDGLFEKYEKEYGASLLPYLPLIFENGAGAEKIRINFYRLIAKLVAKAFSSQLSKWCREHDAVFSGHYLGEETLYSHTALYGDLLPVVMAADYPGIDILRCVPESYNCNTAKYVQMAVRKNNTNGMMVEFCPFYDKEKFIEDPWNNISAISGLLALHGVRRFHSYFRADLKEFDERFKNVNGSPGKDASTLEECRQFNEYVGRIGYMLDGLKNECNVFVYRPIEDAQSKFIPTISAALPSAARETDNRVAQIVNSKLFPSGVDFQYVDVDDLVAAVESIKNGKPHVSGCEIKLLVVPATDIIDTRAKKAMVELKKAGVTVLFNNKIPTMGTDPQNDVNLKDHFEATGPDKIMEFVNAMDVDFSAKADGVQLHTAKYIKDGKEMYFVVNNTRGADAELTLNHKIKTTATLYNPIDGTTKEIKVGDTYTVPSFRSVFIIFD